MSSLPPTGLAADRIVLVGPMGCGKSTVGAALAGVTGWPYLDNDSLLVAETGLSAREILADGGADALHVQESRILRLALAAPLPLVIGVAASAVDSAPDRELLIASGHVVYLRAGLATLAERVRAIAPGGRADRPFLGDEPEVVLGEMLSRRAGAYEDVAWLVVDVDSQSPEQIADRILSQWRGES
ncbi:MAG: shikimate kinase [Acidimicrobiales bacterium]